MPGRSVGGSPRRRGGGKEDGATATTTKFPARWRDKENGGLSGLGRDYRGHHNEMLAGTAKSTSTLFSSAEKKKKKRARPGFRQEGLGGPAKWPQEGRFEVRCLSVLCV
jgi:hypothetical protein